MISAVILTKDEEDNIIDCIESLSFVDEVIVIDDNSTDRTLELIKNLKDEKIKVFSRSLMDDFSAQRNFGLSKASGEWVLFIDADERIFESLTYEILNSIVENSNYTGFRMKRNDSIWGKLLKHGEAGDTELLRLAKKDAGRWEGNVHEAWKIKGRIGELKNPLMHYPHSTIKEFLREINFYTDIRATQLYKQGIQVYWLSIIFYPVGKFFLNYFLKLGFLDGLEGLVFALMMAFHSFLVRGKLWQLWQEERRK